MFFVVGGKKTVCGVREGAIPLLLPERRIFCLKGMEGRVRRFADAVMCTICLATWS